MNSKRSLLTALVGLAMLATPITAAAYDNNYKHNNSHAARVASSVNSTRSFAATRNFNHSFANTNAVARHVSLNWDAVGTMYGQHAFGLELRGQY